MKSTYYQVQIVNSKTKKFEDYSAHTTLIAAKKSAKTISLKKMDALADVSKITLIAKYVNGKELTK